MEVSTCINNSKYLKLFSNHFGYRGYLFENNRFTLPNVSYCVEEGKVHYGVPKDKLYLVYEVEDTVNPTNLFIGYPPTDLIDLGMLEDDFLLDDLNMKLSELTREEIE